MERRDSWPYAYRERKDGMSRWKSRLLVLLGTILFVLVSTAVALWAVDDEVTSPRTSQL
jgi:hypothetical protein